MIYYTSDLHLGHKRILDFEVSSFSSLEDRQDLLIANWNMTVTSEDIVYILGDLFYGKKLDYKYILTSLNGKKVLIKGNHDQWIEREPELESLFEGIYDYKVILDDNRKVVLFHYPIADWNHKHYNSYHLYGHVHSRKSESTEFMDKQENAFNVCTEVNNFRPVLLDTLIENFKRKPQ